MHILLVTNNSRSVSKLQKEFRKSDITSTTIIPKEIGKIWLTQFHLVQIHPPISKPQCRSVIKKIKNSNWEIPILLPFEIGTEIPKTKIIPKNTTLPELKRIIKTVSKREQNGPKKLRYKSLVLDIDRRTAKRRNETVSLRNKEFFILKLLMQKHGKIVSKNEIAEALWDRNATILSNTIEVHISNLRKKIDNGFTKKLIHTIPYIGYKFGK